MQRAEKPFRADLLKLPQTAELKQPQEPFSTGSLVIFAALSFRVGRDSRGFGAGSKQRGAQCFISALVLALSSWTTQARTRLATPRQIWTGSCSELQAGRQHLPRAPLNSQGCPHCAQGKTKTLALSYKCPSETRSYQWHCKHFGKTDKQSCP